MTGVPPAQMFFGDRARFSRLPSLQDAPQPDKELIRARDERLKRRTAQREDRRHGARHISFERGEIVLRKEEVCGKWQTNFAPHRYVVTDVKGSRVRAEPADGSGRPKVRNRSFFKRFYAAGPPAAEATESSQGEKPTDEKPSEPSDNNEPDEQASPAAEPASSEGAPNAIAEPQLRRTARARAPPLRYQSIDHRK